MELKVYNKAEAIRRNIYELDNTLRKIEKALNGISDMKDEVDLYIPESWNDTFKFKLSKGDYSLFLEFHRAKIKLRIFELKKEFEVL